MAKKEKNSGGRKAGKDKDVLESRGKYPIDCKLTDTEVAKLARQLVETRGKIAGKEAEKQAADAAIKGDIELLEESANKLQELIRDGTQQRDTECITQFDWRSCEVRLLRADNREVLMKRNMTAEERQKEMFEAGAKGHGKLLFFDGGKTKDKSEHAPVEGSTWRWPKDATGPSDGKGLSTIGEAVLAGAGKTNDKRLRDGAPAIADELMVKTPTGSKKGTVCRIDGTTLLVDIGDGGMPVQVDLNGKDWSWPKDETKAAGDETDGPGGGTGGKKKGGGKNNRGDKVDTTPPPGCSF